MQFKINKYCKNSIFYIKSSTIDLYSVDRQGIDFVIEARFLKSRGKLC